ncbi:hypothetical protein [Nocardioides nanhaiensis]|uniref:Glycosyl hydrolase family protein n=1 Tax=Nocardioides nanhaiensis TaxID=1476871 RepID=A0ABP8X286_9ACTN
MRRRPTHPVRALAPLVTTALLAAAVPALAAHPGSGGDDAARGSHASAAPAAQATRGRITLTPRAYIAGETLTIRGTVGARGSRPIMLQRYMRDRYLDAERGRTTQAGRFGFRIPGPGMATPYSVQLPGTGLRTPNAPVTPVEQTFSFATTPSAPRAGQAVTLRVTSAPARPGRPLTLLRRTSPSSWAKVATASADAQGAATFGVTAAAGDAVYRVMAGAMPGRGISEYPSYPFYLRSRGSERAGVANAGAVPVTPGAARAPYTQPGPVNAGNTFDWGRATESHEWEYGEPLGAWREYGTGSGRVAPAYAMLTVESGPGFYGADDLGTTRATLSGRGSAYGRWEIRMRAPHWQDGPDYRVKAELVPAGTAPGACSPHTVTFADFTGYGNSVDLGVSNGSRAWAHSERGVVTNRDNWHTYAVEVTRNRITWFVDAKVTATLPGRAAVSGKALVPRISLIAPDDTTQMRHTRIGMDWLRSWGLERPGSAAAGQRRAPQPKAGRDLSC